MSLRRSQQIDYRAIIVALMVVLTLLIALIINAHINDNQTAVINNDLVLDNGDENINWDKYQTIDMDLSNFTTIVKSGVYHLTGTLNDAPIIINADNSDVKLILDNVTVNNASGPAIACYSADNLVLELVGENYLEDGTSYDQEYDEDVNGTIYSKSDLAFRGKGTLHLTANFQDGIVGKDDVKFNGGSYVITATDDGIRGKDSVNIVDGYFEIKSTSDAIKSTNDTYSGKGYVLIQGGTFSINSGDDGIRASQELRVDGGTINISGAYEGLEAQVVIINGGDISLTTNDDGINAGSNSSTSTSQSRNDMDPNCILTINGGNIYVNASGDGVDSNGYLYFNGGTTVIDGPTGNGNGALDSGAGITMNGGTVIAVGSSGMAETLGSSSNIYNISVFLSSQLSPNTRIDIKDADGNTLLSHVSAKSFSYLAAGTSDFSLNGVYTIYVNDEKYQDFVISSTTTTIGNNNNIFNNGFRR